jgi:hypothetical protein
MKDVNLSPVKITKWLFTAGLCIIFYTCSPVRHIHPLETGESSVSAGIGGPITDVGIYMPLPMLTVGYNRGMPRKIDLETRWHVTMAAYGVLGLDAGANWRPLSAKKFRPGIILSPRLHTFYNFQPGALRLYPDITATLWWKLHERWYLYTGIENWFDLYRRNDGVEQDIWAGCPFVGVELGRKRWHVQIEGRLYTPDKDNSGRGPKNIGIGEKGIWGAFIGVSRSFGGTKE